MFPVWLRVIFAVAAIVGLLFLIISIYKIITLYNNPNTVEFSATVPSNIFEIKQSGKYEIAVKTPSLFGIVPYKISVRLIDIDNNIEIPVHNSVNLFSQRKTLSGERIVPVAKCKIDKPGKYELNNLSTNKFKEKDKLQIAPKTGYMGVLLILAILFSAIIFIGGSVMTVLSIKKNNSFSIKK